MRGRASAVWAAPVRTFRSFSSCRASSTRDLKEGDVSCATVQGTAIVKTNRNNVNVRTTVLPSIRLLRVHPRAASSKKDGFDRYYKEKGNPIRVALLLRLGGEGSNGEPCVQPPRWSVLLVFRDVFGPKGTLYSTKPPAIVEGTGCCCGEAASRITVGGRSEELRFPRPQYRYPADPCCQKSSRRPQKWTYYRSNLRDCRAPPPSHPAASRLHP